jgi:FKBP-type peptidyl-prolyl cis-trans isomerase SlyD
MKIQKNSVVTLTYDLYTTKDGEETFVEQTTTENPLVFLYGRGLMLPKFEENLTGLTSGDSYDFKLSAADAYGEKDEGSFAELSYEMFADMDMYPEIDSVFPLQDAEGNQYRGRVVEITDDAIIVDLNHPMAGQDLHFKGVILQVRDATTEELVHGHAHGPDGHSGH